MLKLREVPRRILTVEEFRQLVESMDRPEIAALVAIMGETGIREKCRIVRKRWEKQYDSRRLTEAAGHSSGVVGFPPTEKPNH